VSRVHKIGFSACLMLLVCSVCVGQQFGDRRFGALNEASRRFDAQRGRLALPSIDLSLEPVREPTLLEEVTGPPIRVRSAFGSAIRFSDNIFLMSASENVHTRPVLNTSVAGGNPIGAPPTALRDARRPADFLSVLTPSVTMNVISKTMPISVSYLADIIQAGSYGEFDAVEQHFNTAADLRIGHGFSLRVANILAHNGVEPRFPGDSLDYYLNNITDVALIYEFGEKFKTSVGYTHDYVRFDAPWNRANNFTVETVGWTGWYKIMPKTSVLVEYAHQQVDDYGQRTDNIRDSFGAGMEWDITSKLSGGMKGGYEWVDFARGHGWGGLYGHAELAYAFSDKLLFGVYMDRHIRQTAALADNLIFGQVYTSTQLAFNTLYRVTPKVGVKGEFFWVNDNFPAQPFGNNLIWTTGHYGLPINSRQEVDTTGFSIGLDWRPKRFLRFGAEYRYQRAAAAISFDNFEENSFLLNASIGF